MANNQIKISVNLDSKDFDQNFKRIMDQITKLRQASSEISRNLGNPANNSTGNTNTGNANTSNFNTNLQKLTTTLTNVTYRTDTFNKNLSTLAKTLDDLSNKAQSAATSTKQVATAQVATAQEETPEGEKKPSAPSKGVPVSSTGQQGGVQDLLKAFGFKGPAGALGAIGTAIGYAGELNKQIGTYPERVAKKEANIADMQSEMMRLQMQGKGYERFLFEPERAKALGRASTRVEKEKSSDVTELLGILASGVSGGALLGGKIGSVGGLAGGVIGGLAGGVIGGVGAFGATMLSDRKRSMLFDQDAYKKEMGSVFAGTYKEQFEAERRKSYKKDLAGQFFEQESGRFRGLQRQYGLSDEELFQGDQSIFRRGARAGYNLDTMTQAMQGISAGGGPTAVATGGAQIAAKMQRNMDLTNAPELLGRISGATGMGAEESKNEIFRMYEQAQKLGLGQTEISGLLQTGANMQYSTGGDLQAITGLLSAGLEGSGLRTDRGIEYSKAALDQLRQQTSEMGGLTGQYGLAELGGENINKLLGTRMVDGKKVQNELSLGQKAYLLGTDITKVSDDYLKGILEDKGQNADKESVANLKKEIIRGKTRSTLRSDEQQKLLEQYQTAQGSEKEKIKDKLKEEYTLRESGFAGLSKEQQESKIEQAAAGLSGDIFTSKATGEAAKKYETQSKRATDEKEAAEAASGVAGNLKNLNEQIPALITSFSNLKTAGEDAAAKWAQLKHLSDLLQTATDAQKQQTEKDIKDPPKADSTTVDTTPHGN